MPLRAQVFSLTLYCSGRGHGRLATDPTNCLRTCGGTGTCAAGCCKERERGHCCSVRLVISATLATALRDKVLVQYTGSHVARGMTAVPPPQRALRMAACVKRDLVEKCTMGRDTPSSAVNQLLPALKRARGQLLAECKVAGGDISAVPSMNNGRFNPPVERLSSVLGQVRSDERGGRDDAALGDWGRLNLFVRRVLIPEGVVLYYEDLSAEKGLLVLATDESLALAREFGLDAAATDCKHDTTRGCRSMYSHVRVPTPWGWVLVAAWIGPAENTATIDTALKALAANVPCSDPTCPHTVTGRWEGHLYRQCRCCSRTFRPWVGTDKHLPTYRAIESAGYRGAVLDLWHGFKAYDQRLLALNIRDSAAVLANGAFRLWTRSESDAKVHCAAHLLPHSTSP